MIAPVPFTTEIGRALVPQAWRAWFTAVKTALDVASQRVAALNLVNQGATIPARSIETLPRLSAGLYRISWYVRITRAATTSSSVTVAFDWRNGGVNPSFTAPAIVGNTIQTNQSGTLLIRVDDGGTIEYSATYASVGATSAQFSLDIIVEAVQV